jgi:hypothetical protein
MRALGRPKAIGARYRSDRNWARFSEASLKYRRTQNVAIEAVAQKSRYHDAHYWASRPIQSSVTVPPLAAASARQRDIPICHI